jgi:hypothetical protein
LNCGGKSDATPLWNDDNWRCDRINYCRSLSLSRLIDAAASFVVTMLATINDALPSFIVANVVTLKYAIASFNVTSVMPKNDAIASFIVA